MLNYGECISTRLPSTVILSEIQSPSIGLNSMSIPLTNPFDPAGNNGYDNINGDLICYKNTEIYDTDGRIFRINKWIGQGQFGQVYECSFVNYHAFQNISTKSSRIDEKKSVEKKFAIKISKSSNDALCQFNYESQALFYVSTY